MSQPGDSACPEVNYFYLIHWSDSVTHSPVPYLLDRELEHSDGLAADAADVLHPRDDEGLDRAAGDEAPPHTHGDRGRRVRRDQRASDL